MYHQWYDDLLMILPMIALYRVIKQDKQQIKSRVMAGLLLALTILSTLAPGGQYLLPGLLKKGYLLAQVIIWLMVLFFLMKRARDKAHESVQ
jgi:hypothetical protein